MASRVFNTVLYKETGVHHIEKGKGCEDNIFRTVCSKTGVTVVTLSDGAGSCKNAAVGSEITSKVAAEQVAHNFDLLYNLSDAEIANFILKKVNLALLERSELDKADLMSYSATLLCGAMHPDGRYITFHVGDGAIIGYNSNNECEVISIYKHSGPVNQTTFVTVKCTEYHVNKGKDGFYAFLLMSDGPEPFLVNEVQISPRTKLMAQLSFFTSEKTMQSQLSSMIALFNQNDMDDDASFVIIRDVRAISKVFNSLTPELKNMLSDINSDITPKEMKRLLKIMELTALYPDGLSVKQLAREMHISPKFLKKKKRLESIAKLKFIEYRNGKFYFS